MSPDHWQETRLRHIADLNPTVPAAVRQLVDSQVTFLPMEAIRELGGFDASSTRRIGDVLTGYSYFEDGDIAFAKVTPCFENAKATVLENLYGGIGFGTTEVTVVRPTAAVDTRFIFYVLMEDRFKQLGQASMTGAGGLKRVPDAFTRNFKIALPDRPEQVAIADFLDRETAAIDAFIADQDELIALLKERRVATISHTVLYGIGNVERFTDHIVRIGQAFEESDMRVASATASELLSVSIHSGVQPWKELHDKEPRSSKLANYKAVRAGNIVLNRMRAFQGALGEVFSAGVVSPDYMVMAVRETASSRYLVYLMKSQWFVSEMSARLRGIGSEEQGTTRTPRINPKDFANIRVPLPALEEQREVVDYLERETAEIGAAINDAKQAIALSKERRAALISAAVTGKIDVRKEAV